MNLSFSDCARNHRIDFAQRFCKNAELHGVFMGFFDTVQSDFSEAWIAQNADCSQETLRSLVRMAQTRLAAHAEGAARLNQSRQLEAQIPPAEQQRQDEARDKAYPVWISNGHNVVGIGAPIAQRFPVMAFPRLGHSDVLEKQSMLRIGMAYVSQQLAEDVDCRNDWPMAALEAVISLLALRIFVVNAAGHVVYHQSCQGKGNAATERIIAGEPFNLFNKRECIAVRNAITAATQEGGKPSMLSVTCMETETRLALVAPLVRPDARLAIVVMGRQQVDNDLQFDFFFDSYEMTPSERLVAREVLRGRQLNEIAIATGLSLSTIRSYLKQIFAKTRTHRQVDLVLLYYQVFPGALHS